MEQLGIPFSYNENFIKGYFERYAGVPVALKITDNARNMISVRPGPEEVSVRLHRIFLDAGIDVLSEVAGFLKKRKKETPLINGFLRRNADSLRKAPNTGKHRTSGAHYDLQPIFDALNEEYFENKISTHLTWGKKTAGRTRRLTLGSFCSITNTIRVNPLLDSKNVPRYFIEFIVYHEMLHAALGSVSNGKRRVVHGAEFRKLERAFKDFDRAAAWERPRLAHRG